MAAVLVKMVYLVWCETVALRPHHLPHSPLPYAALHPPARRAAAGSWWDTHASMSYTQVDIVLSLQSCQANDVLEFLHHFFFFNFRFYAAEIAIGLFFLQSKGIIYRYVDAAIRPSQLQLLPPLPLPLAAFEARLHSGGGVSTANLGMCSARQRRPPPWQSLGSSVGCEQISMDSAPSAGSELGREAVRSGGRRPPDGAQHVCLLHVAPHLGLGSEQSVSAGRM